MKIQLTTEYAGKNAGETIDCRDHEALFLINGGKGRNADGVVSHEAKSQETKPKEEGKK